MKKLFLAILTCSLLFSFSGCSTTNNSQNSSIEQVNKEIKNIEIGKLPTKTSYYIGEKFSIEGGTIKVTYTDSSNEEISMSDKDVSITEPNMSMSGTKTVIVKYKNKKVNFKITVSVEPLKVTINLNYPNANNYTVDVNKGEYLTKPTTPTREKYVFYNWYIDSTCSTLFEFENNKSVLPITSSITIYAMWLEEGVNYYNFNFDNNYYGDINITSQLIKENEKAIKPTDPVRTGYKFINWYSDNELQNVYNFDNNVNKETTIYAKWEKTVSGINTYTFEAEDTDLSNKVGPGFSGSAAERNMVCYDDKIDANGNRFVSFLYAKGLSLDFYLASDIETTNCELYLRLSGEMASFTLTPDNYIVCLNDNNLTYAPISFEIKNQDSDLTNTTKLPFKDYLIKSNLKLNKGKNSLFLITNNSDNFVGGGTIAGTAPMVDCIKLKTDAVVTWDKNYSLPAKNY